MPKMPSRPQEDPGAQIEAIVQEAARRILALFQARIQAELATLRSALLSEGGRATPRISSRRSEATRATTRTTTRATTHATTRATTPATTRATTPATTLATTSREPVDRVSTLVVVEALRKVLRSRWGGMRIADLREATGYSNMQLHRGLDRLIQGGEVLREGGQRKTVFRLASRKLRGQGSSPASGNAKPSPKGEAQPRISTSAVAKAALGNLRGRRNGLGMAELREATGYTRAQLHRALVTLHQEGKIHRTGEPHALRYHFRR